MDDLFRIAKESGVRVEYCSLPLNESVSAQDPDGDFILMDYGLIASGASERVHLAHELGHCATGSFYKPYSKLDIRGRHEYRANKWAIHKLVPFCSLNKALKQGATEVWELAEYFNVTEDFIRAAIFLYQSEGKLDA